MATAVVVFAFLLLTLRPVRDFVFTLLGAAIWLVIILAACGIAFRH
jgi:hypothetical protein